MTDDIEVGQGLPESDGSTPEDVGEALSPEGSAGEEQEAAPVEPEPEAAIGAAEEDTEEDPVSKLVNTKYGGDKQKFVDGLHETWKSSAAMRRELNELKSKLQEINPPKPEAQPEPPKHIADDLKYIEGEMKSLGTEVQTNEARQGQILQEAESIRFSIAKLEGKLEVADEYEKAEIKRQINEATGEIKSLANEYKGLDQRNRTVNFEIRNFNQKRLELDQKVKSYQEQLKQEQANQRATVASIRQQFDQTFSAALDKYGFRKDPEFRADLDETVRAEIAYHIANLPAGSPPIDMEAETLRRVAKHAKLHGLTEKKTVQELTRQKVQGATAVAPKGSSLPKPEGQPAPSKKPWTAEFAKERARKILGG